MILVTGASGNVGGELVRLLQRRGQPVRALIHGSRPSWLRDTAVVDGDLDQPATLAPSLRGVRSVFLLPGYRDMPGLLAAVRDAGVERVVQLSGGSAGSGDLGNAISAYMIRSERAVFESGLPWTVLRPAAFMSNALRWVHKLAAGNILRLPFATVRTATIDPADVAAVAAEALLSEGHDGQIYFRPAPRPSHRTTRSRSSPLCSATTSGSRPSPTTRRGPRCWRPHPSNTLTPSSTFT